MDNSSTVILALSLIIIMLGMGLSLTVRDFVQVFIHPKAILIGLTCQLLLLPIIGFFLINVFTLEPAIAIGIIILVACPGGPTSNLITHLAKGDTALSVSMTALSSLITLVTIPFVINIGLQQVLGESTDIQLNVLEAIRNILIIVILPVGLGMLIRAKGPNFANWMAKPVKTASAVVFIAVLLGILIKERTSIVSYFQQAGTATLTLNLLTMGLGYGLGYLFKLPTKQRISISIEGGIQNGTLAISIATILLGNTAYAISPAVYSLLMFLTSGAFIFWSNRQVHFEK